MKTQFLLLTLSLNLILFYNASAASAASTIHEHAAEELKTIFHCFDPHTYTPPPSIIPVAEEIRTLGIKAIDPKYPTGQIHAHVGLLVEAEGPRFIHKTEDGRIKITKQEPKPENVFETVEGGRDGRMRIEHTDKWPHAVHGYLKIMYPNDKEGYYMGTGILVGPSHVLTAGHNIYSHKEGEGWPSKITFIPGRNVVSAPFGAIQAKALLGIEGWCKEKNESCDMGMVILSEPVGYQTGWYGLLTGDKDPLQSMLKDLNVNVTGYPIELGNAPYQGTEMWTMGHPITSLDARQLYYQLDTSVGQSGSGVWITYNEKRYIVGIHTYGDEKERRNLATRISTPMFNLIIEWLKGHYELEAGAQERLHEASTKVVQKESKVDKGKIAILERPSSASVEALVEAREHTSAASSAPVTKKDIETIKVYEQASAGNREALKFLEAEADKENVIALGTLSILYATTELSTSYLKRNKEKSSFYASRCISRIKEEGRKGNAYAQWILGCMYRYGLGTNKDFAKALRLLNIAASKNLAEAHNVLGEIYYYSRPGEIDFNEEKGLNHLTEAAMLGHVEAQAHLGAIYAQGFRTAKKESEGEKWLKLASSSGYPTAQVALANFYMQQMYNNQNLLLADKREYIAQFQKGVRLFKEAAERGHPDANYMLGYMYEQALGSANIEALRFYINGATEGNIDAMKRLVEIYEKGAGKTKKDVSKAAFWRGKIEEIEIVEDLVSPRSDTLDRLSSESASFPSLVETTTFGLVLPDASTSRGSKTGASSLLEGISGTSALSTYSGILNGRTINFQEEEVRGDGDCGFHALGISRDVAVQKLMAAKDDEDIRKLVAQEIKAMFIIGHLPASIQADEEYIRLSEDYKRVNSILDDAVRTINNRLPFPERERKNAGELLVYLAEHDLETDATALSDKLESIINIEREIEVYCNRPEIYEAYITNYLATGGWLSFNRGSVASLDAIAKLNYINVYIWRKDAADPTKLNLIHKCSDDARVQTIHMLHTHGGTHYNFLVEVTAKEDNEGAGMSTHSSDNFLIVRCGAGRPEDNSAKVM